MRICRYFDLFETRRVLRPSPDLMKAVLDWADRTVPDRIGKTNRLLARREEASRFVRSSYRVLYRGHALDMTQWAAIRAGQNVAMTVLPLSSWTRSKAVALTFTETNSKEGHVMALIAVKKTLTPFLDLSLLIDGLDATSSEPAEESDDRRLQDIAREAEVIVEAVEPIVISLSNVLRVF